LCVIVLVCFLFCSEQIFKGGWNWLFKNGGGVGGNGGMRGLWGGTEPVAPVKARLKTAKNGESRMNFEELIGALYSAQVAGN